MTQLCPAGHRVDSRGACGACERRYEPHELIEARGKVGKRCYEAYARAYQLGAAEAALSAASEVELLSRGDRGSGPAKLEVLFGLVRALEPELVFESGTYTGRSALAIGSALEANGHGRLVTADPFDHGQRKTLQDLERVEVLLLPGEIVLESMDSIDFAYIDCAWKTRARTFELAVERLSPGGMIVVDDVLHPNWRRPAEDGEGLDRVLELCQLVLPAFHGLGFYTDANPSSISFRSRHDGQNPQSAGIHASG